jgi:hypothetical protein
LGWAGERGEDSSYDSECEDESAHRAASRTPSDTLAAEFAEYVTLATPQPNQVRFKKLKYKTQHYKTNMSVCIGSGRFLCVVCMYFKKKSISTYINLFYRIHYTSLVSAYFGLDKRECLEDFLLINMSPNIQTRAEARGTQR